MLTQAVLKEYLIYDSNTGVFTRRISSSNRVKAGDIAGSLTDTGYLRIRVQNVTYKAHRLAWLYVYGEFPAENIDHVNTIRTDNRICNLRAASFSDNNHNQSLRSNNTSGYKGVSWNSQFSKWVAKIGIEGKRKFIGFFETPEEAYKAYCLAAISNYGEFFNPGLQTGDSTLCQ
jgi:hypothetical protein